MGRNSRGENVNEYHFQYKKKEKDLRLEVLKLLKKDHFPFSPSYMRKQKKLVKGIKTKHETFLKEILGGSLMEDLLDDDLYDWLFFEKKKFELLKKF